MRSPVFYKLKIQYVCNHNVAEPYIFWNIKKDWTEQNHIHSEIYKSNIEKQKDWTQ